jgi:hypothetical protein
MATRPFPAITTATENSTLRFIASEESVRITILLSGRVQTARLFLFNGAILRPIMSFPAIMTATGNSILQLPARARPPIRSLSGGFCKAPTVKPEFSRSAFRPICRRRAITTAMPEPTLQSFGAARPPVRRAFSGF